MAEVTPGRARAEKEILLIEDFEAITHHAEVAYTTGAYITRSPEAAHAGHAGLELFAPAAANAFARAEWTTRSTRNPLIALRAWIKLETVPANGHITLELRIQKRDTFSVISIRYNTATNKWEFLNESNVYQELTEVTTILSEDIWQHITIEVDTGKKRIVAMHIGEESYRFNRAYYVTPGSWAITYMLVAVQLNASAAGEGQLYIDDLIVQEL
jgi:hypothetical protein